MAERVMGLDGQPLQLCGVAAVFGARAGDYRVSRECKFTAVRDAVLTIEHMSDHVRLAWTRFKSLRLWTNNAGLCFSADVENDGYWRQALALLREPGIGCSFVGWGDMMRAADGVTEYLSVDLEDVSVATNPRFPQTACWRSDWRADDLPPDKRALFAAFHANRLFKPIRNCRSTSPAASFTPRRLARPAAEMTPRPAAAAHREQAAATAYDNARRVWEARGGPRACSCNKTRCECVNAAGRRFDAPPRAQHGPAHERVDVIAVCNEIAARNRARASVTHNG